MKRNLLPLLLLAAILILASCSASARDKSSDEHPDSSISSNDSSSKEDSSQDLSSAADTADSSEALGYSQISQDEAKEMMKLADGHIIVDVRRQDEFDSGHIPDAVCIPNETIGTEQPAELPSLDQIILVYCRSGNRSKQASQKLADMGYTNVYEFGGIIGWDGEVVIENTDDQKQLSSLL